MFAEHTRKAKSSDDFKFNDLDFLFSIFTMNHVIMNDHKRQLKCTYSTFYEEINP